MKSEIALKTIFACGNPLLDTIVLLNDDTLLRKHNLKPDGQKEVLENEMQALKNDLKNFEKTQSAGGCAQNTLKVMQWLNKNQFKATIFGAIGNDSDGQILKDILKSSNIQTHYLTKHGLSTGTTISLVYKDCRSLVAHLGAAENISLIDLGHNLSLLDDIKTADIIYIEAFFLTKRTEVATYILTKCKLYKKLLVFNLCGQYLFREYFFIIANFIESSNLIFGHKNEFESLRDIFNFNNLEDLLMELGQKQKIVVVTNGSSAILYKDGNKENNISKYHVVPATEEETVDTTGAGDSFVGGFLFAYLHQKPIEECLQYACYAAKEIIKRRGCTVPS